MKRCGSIFRVFSQRLVMRKVRWTLGHVPSTEKFHVNRPCQQYARALLKPHNPALLAVSLTFWSAALEREQHQLVSALRLERLDDSSAEKTLKNFHSSRRSGSSS